MDWKEKLQQREYQLLLVQLVGAALIMFGVIDLESMDAVTGILQSATGDAVKSAEGINTIVAGGWMALASQIFTISRGMAKSE